MMASGLCLLTCLVISTTTMDLISTASASLPSSSRTIDGVSSGHGVSNGHGVSASSSSVEADSALDVLKPVMATEKVGDVKSSLDGTLTVNGITRNKAEVAEYAPLGSLLQELRRVINYKVVGIIALLSLISDDAGSALFGRIHPALSLASSAAIIELFRRSLKLSKEDEATSSTKLTTAGLLVPTVLAALVEGLTNSSTMGTVTAQVGSLLGVLPLLYSDKGLKVERFIQLRLMSALQEEKKKALALQNTKQNEEQLEETEKSKKEEANQENQAK